MPDPRVTSPDWQPMIAPYARPDLRKALWQLATSLLPFLAMWPIMFWAGRISYWLVLPLALVTGAFWIRTFIIFHDLGFILGVLTLTPFTSGATITTSTTPPRAISTSGIRVTCPP